MLEGDDRRAKEVSGQTIGTYLSNHHSLRFVVLDRVRGWAVRRPRSFCWGCSDACKAGRAGRPRNAVRNSDRAAIHFSERLYRALVRGDPIDAALSECAAVDQ